MSLHRLNKGATEPCPVCDQAVDPFNCDLCSGTGRVPGELDVAMLHKPNDVRDAWFYICKGETVPTGPYPTQAAALIAAREASREAR